MRHVQLLYVFYICFFLLHRPVNNVQGLTGETTTALLTTIESIEWEQRERAKLGIGLEHPRASTTDDVECFFSVIWDLVGKSFTLNTVQDEWKKVCIEFEKRESSDLPFFTLVQPMIGSMKERGLNST